MKNIIFLLLLLPLLVQGQENLNQTDSKGLKQGRWEKRFPNGGIMYEGSFKNNKPYGEWKRYHESGGIKAILLYNEDNDSVKARLFESSSFPVAEGIYLHEKKSGKWTWFSEKTKISEEEYVNGMKNGICRKFYPTGELLEESVWKDDRREGKYQAFYQSGKPYLQCMYRNNRRNGRCFSYFPSGLPEMEANYTDDLQDGDCRFLDENGNLRFTLHYEKGILKNPEVLIQLDTNELDKLEKQRDRLTDPEKYLENPVEYLNRKR
jgi:antitoxin component YwqK of YwqJK toxin-antitoxin module